MNIHPFRAWYPKLEKIPSPDVFFGSLKEKYVAYREADFFKQLPEAAFFIYRILTKENSFIGLLVATPTAEYEAGNILKHEKTIARKEEKTKELILHRQAIVKPVLLTYPTVDQINQLLLHYTQNKAPLYSTFFEADQQTHQIWNITDSQVTKQFQDLFKKKVKTSYIADGHHRTTTMSLLKQQFAQQPAPGDFSQLMVSLFGADQLKIHAFNRVVEIGPNYTPVTFLKKMAALGTLKKLDAPRKPTKKHELVLFAANNWYALSWHKALLVNKDQLPSLLDVQILNEHVLKGILGVQDIRNDQRISYVEGTKGWKGLAAATLQNTNTVGFYLFPVKIEDLMAMADQRILLPPKSTYFEPRVKNGLLIKKLNSEHIQNREARTESSD